MTWIEIARIEDVGKEMFMTYSYNSNTLQLVGDLRKISNANVVKQGVLDNISPPFNKELIVRLHNETKDLPVLDSCYVNKLKIDNSNNKCGLIRI